MTNFGYTLMTEQSGPKELVEYAVAAENIGFDFEVSSDHQSPWLSSQGHAPYAWTVLGAVAQATERVELMTYVTCPTIRYHPAIIAQKAATLQILADGRFTLGLGSGENLNEHVVGEGWPSVDKRQDVFEEALQIIRRVLEGGLITFDGRHFRVDSMRLWDLPEGGIDIGVAVSGDKSVERFGPLAEYLIAVEPKAELVEAWNKVCSGEGQVATPLERSARYRSAGIPTKTQPSPAPTTSSAGSQAVGPSTPTCPPLQVSRVPRSSSGPRRRRQYSVRTGPRRDCRGRPALLGSRLHRHRPRPGRR